MNNSLMRLLIKFFGSMSKKVSKFRKIKESDERQLSNHYGISTIILSIITIAVVLSSVYFLKSLMDFDNPIVVIFGTIVCIVIPIYMITFFLVHGLLNIIFQFILNRRFISWFAFAFLIASIVVMVLCAISILE